MYAAWTLRCQAQATIQIYAAYREERYLDAMRKVTSSLCVLALALVGVLMVLWHFQSANPSRLIISSIGIDTAVESVGMLDNGTMATPALGPWDDVGWYADGPRPGEVGSAVIDGHLDRPGGSPAVFWNLRSIHVGDSVIVTDTKGGTKRFRVTRIALYRPQQAPLQKIFGDKSGSHLNLITCAGDWIVSEHQTTLRLVVYTILVR